jgi:hypothetical protein
MVETPFERGTFPDRILQDQSAASDFLTDGVKAAALVLFRHNRTVRGVRFCNGESVKIG